MSINSNIPLPAKINIIPYQEPTNAYEKVKSLPCLPICEPFGAVPVFEELENGPSSSSVTHINTGNVFQR
jgi:hypothetical protein